MLSSRTSAMISGRAPGRDKSLLLVALMFGVLGVVATRNIFPAWHELQAQTQRREELKLEVERKRAQVAAIQDEIDALNDPYYIRTVLQRDYRFRPDPKAEPWRKAIEPAPLPEAPTPRSGRKGG